MAKVISLVDKAVLPLPKLKKVAAYARVSTEKDAMLHSLSAQVSYYSTLIQNHPGWEYVGVYSDNAFTGTKADRPNFQRLLSDCKSGKIDMVLTKSISRFARNTVDLLKIVRELKELGVDVYFEREHIHSISPDGELMLSILASFAQAESLSASENVKWQIRNKFKNGELANFRFMYGYKVSKNKIEVNEKEANVVRWIFDQYIKGIGSTKIAQRLEQLNISKPRGGKWTADSVRNILLNEKYTGNALLQKRFVYDHLSKKLRKNRGELPMFYVTGTHKAIIEEQVYKKAHKILEINRQKGKINGNGTKIYSFTGKIKCLKCNKNFKRRINNKKVYWSCSTYIKFGRENCSTKAIPEQILMSKTMEVLGIKNFDNKLFEEKIKQIQVPCDNKLTFVFTDGTQKVVAWENLSRSESWTDEKRQLARIRALQQIQKGE